MRMLEMLGIEKNEWKWRYLITCPLLGLLGAVIFILAFTFGAYLMFCVLGGGTP